MSFLRFVRFLLAVLLAGTAAFVAGATPAAALDCGSGSGPGRVTIDSPRENAVVSGSFQVRGTASVGLGVVGEISRIEVTLGGRTIGEDVSPDTAVDFNVTFDASNVAPGERTLVVVACGESPLGAILGRGSASIALKVEAAPVPTTGRTTTTSAGSASAIGAGAAGPSTTTTAAGSVAAAAIAAGGPSATVTTTAKPTTTQAEARGPAATKPEPVRPRSGPDAPLVLTETPDRGSSGPPLWVGAVVGVSGGLGLLFSAASWRRRTHGPVRAEPVDPDLVDVR